MKTSMRVVIFMLGLTTLVMSNVFITIDVAEISKFKGKNYKGKKVHTIFITPGATHTIYVALDT